MRSLQRTDEWKAAEVSNPELAYKMLRDEIYTHQIPRAVHRIGRYAVNGKPLNKTIVNYLMTITHAG